MTTSPRQSPPPPPAAPPPGPPAAPPARNAPQPPSCSPLEPLADRKPVTLPPIAKYVVRRVQFPCLTCYSYTP
ncbi:MAG: hypothetical protein O7G85_07795, partial [Planctomycetota bacterium]|nr:hypothetical protein [Planctomycetota bacterium]